MCIVAYLISCFFASLRLWRCAALLCAAELLLCAVAP